ncbi:MAG TPA: T9SS type A sorting domain-containing protein, partial [Bacteroidia bacterium]|nr:T9SS type A sorting domain-containing protein [Bacteroidia bacterium]
PEVFAKGAVMAGAPHKAASNASQAVSVGQGTVIKTPQTWGSLVTSEFPSYTGTYPTVAVFHGSADNVVNINNETEIMKQWTNVHNTDQTADAVINSFNGNAFVTKNVFNDSSGHEVIETYTLSGMGHAIALDTGSCYQKCGKTGTYAYEVYFSATFWAAYFFDILIPPYTISGLQVVNANQTGVTYSVTNTAGSTYTWTVPAGAVIASGQGTNQITVNYGTQSGYVEVEETQSNTCRNGPSKLYVTVNNASAVAGFTNEEIKILQTGNNSLFIKTNDEKYFRLRIYSYTGAVVFDEQVAGNSPVLLRLDMGIYVAEVVSGNSIRTKKLYVVD